MFFINVKLITLISIKFTIEEEFINLDETEDKNQDKHFRQ